MLSSPASPPRLPERARRARPPPQPPSGEVWLTDQQVRDGHIAVEPVGVHAVGNDVVTSGKVTFDDLRVAHIFSPVTGRVTRILADPGAAGEEGGAAGAIESPDVGNAFADLGKAAGGADRRRARLPAPEGALRGARRLADATSRRPQDSYGKAKAEMERARAEGAPVPRRAAPTPSRRSSCCARRSRAR